MVHREASERVMSLVLLETVSAQIVVFSFILWVWVFSLNVCLCAVCMVPLEDGEGV